MTIQPYCSLASILLFRYLHFLRTSPYTPTIVYNPYTRIKSVRYSNLERDSSRDTLDFETESRIAFRTVVREKSEKKSAIGVFKTNEIVISNFITIDSNDKLSTRLSGLDREKERLLNTT